MEKMVDGGRGMSGSRDPVRTPMQWDRTRNAGFSDGEPWLPIDSAYKTHNVVTELADNDSFFALDQTLLRLRREDETMTKGAYVRIESYKDILAFERTHGETNYMVVLNFSDKKRDVFVSYLGEIVCSTYPARHSVIAKNGEVTLQPYQGIVVKV